MLKKVILYVGNFDLPSNSAAGKRVYYNAKILKDAGYKVYLLGKSKQNITLIKLEDDIYFHAFPLYKLFDVYKYFFYFKFFLAENDINPDLIIRYGSPTLSFFDYLITQWCKKNNCKIVSDVVDWLYSDSGNFIFNLIKNIDTYLEKAIFNKKSDGIIAISDSIKKYYSKTMSNIVTIPPLTDTYKKNNSINKNIHLVYAGIPFRIGYKIKDVHKMKDRIDLCVTAVLNISKSCNIKFDIFGITKEEYCIAFPNQRKELENCDAILFHGKQNMHLVQSYINKADFSILIREKNRATMFGFPTKVVESLSFGTPVVTTDTSDLARFILNNYNGFLININEIETSLRNLCKLSTEEMIRLKNNCSCNNDFYYAKYVNSVTDFLNTLFDK